MSDARILISAEDQVSAVLGRISSSLSAFGGGAVGALGPVAAALAALGAAVATVKGLTGSLDDLSEAAQGVGTTATALANMRAAAVTAGVDAEKLDKALSGLANRLDDAAKGGAQSALLFKTLGVEFRNADGSLRDGAAVMGDIAEKFRGFADGAEKTAVANQLFGDKLGRVLIPYLNQGRDGLQAYSGVTDDAVKAAERLQLQFDQMALSGTRFKNELAGLVIPEINALIDRFNAGRAAGLSFLDALFQRAGKGSSLSDLRKELEDTVAVIGRVGNGPLAGTNIGEAELDRLIKKATYLRSLIAAAEAPPAFEDGFTGSDASRPRAPRVGDAAAIAKAAAERQRAREKEIAAQFADARRVRENRQKLEEETAEANERIRQQAVALETSQNEAARNRLETVRAALMSETEAENARYQGQVAALQTALALQQIAEDDYRRTREEAELQHQARLGDINAQGALERRKFAELNAQQQAQSVLGTIVSLTAGVAQQNRTMFEINKASSIASAIIDTYAASVRAMKDWPYPINIGIAALTAAAGFARVNAIRSTKFGSSSAPSVGFGGATPVTPADTLSPTPVTPAAAQAPARAQVIVNVVGLSGDRLLTSQQVRDLIRQIGEEGGFGAQITIQGA